MAITSLTIEGVPVPRTSNAKPKRIVRGRRLKALVNAIAHLNSLQHQDDHESRKASMRQYTPFLILGVEGDAVNKAFVKVMAALQNAKTLTA